MKTRDKAGPGALHENLGRHEAKPPSEASFGYTFAFVSALIGLSRWRHAHADFSVWLGVAVLFACFGRFYPRVFKSPNAVWFQLGEVLFTVVNPLIMFLMFAFLITPFAFILRVCGVKFLGLGKSANPATYWIEKTPSPSDSFKNQF